MCGVKEVYMFRFRGICTELAPAQCLWGAEIQTSVKSRFKLIFKKYSPIIHYLFWKHAMAPNKSVFQYFGQRCQNLSSTSKTKKQYKFQWKGSHEAWSNLMDNWCDNNQTSRSSYLSWAWCQYATWATASLPDHQGRILAPACCI